MACLPRSHARRRGAGVGPLTFPILTFTSPVSFSFRTKLSTFSLGPASSRSRRGCSSSASFLRYTATAVTHYMGHTTTRTSSPWGHSCNGRHCSYADAALMRMLLWGCSTMGNTAVTGDISATAALLPQPQRTPPFKGLTTVTGILPPQGCCCIVKAAIIRTPLPGKTLLPWGTPLTQKCCHQGNTATMGTPSPWETPLPQRCCRYRGH